MPIIVDLLFDFLQLALSCLVLSNLVKARKGLNPNSIKWAVRLLYLVILMEVAENTVELGLMGKRFGDEDDVTLEVLLVALAATATYYATKAKRSRSPEPLGTATICTVWLVTAYTLESFLGILMDIVL